MNHKLIGLALTTAAATGGLISGELVMIPLGIILGALYYFGKVAK